MGQKVETRSERIRKKSRQRREQDKEELRQIILKAAGELFLEQGYDRFSMRQLAERIGYSATTLYLYFRDKDDLLFTVVDKGFTRFKQQLAAARASSDDPWTQLMQLGEAYIHFGLSNPIYYQLMFMRRSDYLTQSLAEEQPRLEAFHILQDTVQDALDTGVMRPGDAKSYSDTLWATMHGIVTLSITLPEFDEERVQNMTDVVRMMIFQSFHKG